MPSGRGDELVVTLWTILMGAVGGALAGAALWRWLRTGAYRIGEDEPRLSLNRSWTVVPAAAAGGALAWMLADLWLAAPAAVEAAVSAAHARALAAGGAMTRREMLKRLRLPRLAKRIG